MKTPREILLKRHQAAQPQLDRIRERVVLGLEERGAWSVGSVERGRHFDALTLQRSTLPTLHVAARTAAQLWWQLIWPSRRIWAGLAVVWLALLAFNLGQGAPVSGGARSAPAPVMVQSFVEQERLLAELLQPGKPAPVAEQPRPATRPRSERSLDRRAC